MRWEFEKGFKLMKNVQTTQSGTTLDNDYWVARKRKAVIRFGCSSWQLHNKFGGDEQAFAKKMGLGVRANEVSYHIPLFI